MRSHKKRSALIIFGPTGVGKSALVEAISADVPSEIINMDIGSFYEPTTIGTAKPDWKSSVVPHHLFDCITTPRNMSVLEYRTKIMGLVDSICFKERLPLIVGGSGFYLNALFFPPQYNQRIPDVVIPQSHNTWKQLNRIDPIRAHQIHPHDAYRVERALQIWYGTGKKPSSLVPKYDALFDEYLVVYVTRDTKNLYDRINKRVHSMFEGGWIDEVKSLCENKEWESFLQHKKIIGYNEIVDHIKKSPQDQNIHTLIASIQKRTRGYARRQKIYWRMLQKKLNIATTKKRVIEVNVTHEEPCQRIKKEIKRLSYISSNEGSS